MSFDLGATTDLCRLLSDPTRLRLLSLLESEDLTVAELTRITRLPQPRVSTHLGRLREAGFVRDRKNGASSFYRLAAGALEGDTGRVYRALKDATEDPVIEEDGARVAAVVADRAPNGAPRSWAESVAGSMQRHYSPGRTWESLARGMVGLAGLGRVVDIGSGDGVIAELLAPHARSVTCVDVSPRVLAAGRRRVASASRRERAGRIEFVRADMHDLPFADRSFDHALLLGTLAHADDAARVLAEAARVLAPGGRLIGVALERHRHRDAVASYDHRNLGHTASELSGMLAAAGFEPITCEVTSREKRAPHFHVMTIHALRVAGAPEEESQ